MGMHAATLNVVHPMHLKLITPDNHSLISLQMRKRMGIIRN